MMGIVLLFVVLPFVAYGQTMVDSFRGDIRSCETSCESSFSGPEASVRTMFNFCRRGCRLLNLIDILDDFNNLNDTKNACFKSCHDSYSDDANVKACQFGCESQLPSAERRKQQMKDYNQNLQNLSPTLYIHKLYSNMIEKVGDQMSRSYYAQTIAGSLVVVAAKSSLVADTRENLNEDGLYNFMETSGIAVRAVDMSSINRNGQLRRPVEKNGLQPVENQLDSELIWRTCIIVKAGTSRLLIGCLILLLVMVAGWVWASSAALSQKGHQMLVEEEKLNHHPCATSSVGDHLQQLLLLDDEAMKASSSIRPLNTVKVIEAVAPSLAISIQSNSV